MQTCTKNRIEAQTRVNSMLFRQNVSHSILNLTSQFRSDNSSSRMTLRDTHVQHFSQPSEVGPICSEPICLNAKSWSLLPLSVCDQN